MDPIINPMRMTGKRVLVTGASSGIGRAICVALSSLGAAVVLVGRDPGRLQATRELLSTNNHQIERFDVRETGSMNDWMMKVAEGGALDGVVHSAGINALRPLKVLNEGILNDVLQTNFSAAIGLARGFRQRGVVSADGGSIVLLASVAAFVGQAGIAAYAGSKGALVAVAKSLAVELARERIRVNCVAPGFVETDMLEDLRGRLTDEQFAKIMDKHPLGIGTPDDVAHAVAYLLSGTGRWITGTTLVVDGGYTA